MSLRLPLLAAALALLPDAGRADILLKCAATPGCSVVRQVDAGRDQSGHGVTITEFRFEQPRSWAVGLECLAGFRTRSARYRYVAAAQHELKPARSLEHRAILDAFRRQDADAAERAMVEHIQRSTRETLGALRSHLAAAADAARMPLRRARANSAQGG